MNNEFLNFLAKEHLKETLLPIRNHQPLLCDEFMRSWNIVCSWAFFQPKRIILKVETEVLGIQFQVDGYVFKGTVAVTIDEQQLYTVLLKVNGQFIRVKQSILLHELVGVLDYFIETGEMSKKEYDNLIRKDVEWLKNVEIIVIL